MSYDFELCWFDLKGRVSSVCPMLCSWNVCHRKNISTPSLWLFDYFQQTKDALYKLLYVWQQNTYNFPLRNISQHSRIFIFGLCTFLLEWSWKLASHFNFSFLSFLKVSCIYTMYAGHVHPSLSIKTLSVLHLIFFLASYSLPYFYFYFAHWTQFCPCAHCCWVYSCRHQEPNCSLASRVSILGALLASIPELLTVLILCRYYFCEFSCATAMSCPEGSIS